MGRILVISENAIVRDPLAASLRLAGYETDVASSGREGLQRALETPPKVILLDGLSGAEMIRFNPVLKAVPIILLSGEASRPIVLRAAQLGIKDFILKSNFSMEGLLNRIRKHVGDAAQSSVEVKPAASAAPAHLHQVLSKEQGMARLQSTTAARPLSGVVMQVIRTADSPTSELSELAALVSQDPVLCTRVLRVANSAAFTGPNKRVFMTIQDSVRHIGVSMVRNIAVSLGVLEALPAGGDDVDRMRNWQHSFATAMLCQHFVDLCPDAGKAAASVAYLVGLCHDLGRILFRTEFAGEYAQVLQAQAQTQRPLEELEREMLGVTQLDVARSILNRLSLPDGIRAPIEEFHSLQHTPAQRPSHLLARLLRLAKPYANGIMMAASAESMVGPLTKAECKSACGHDNPSRPDASSLRGQILAMTPLLARLSPELETKLQHPILGRTECRVCLVREPALSEFDPVEAALQSLSQVDVCSDFPPDGAEYNAIVLMSRQRNPLRGHRTAPVLRLALDPPGEAGSPEGKFNADEECGRTISLERLAGFLTRPLPAISKAA